MAYVLQNMFVSIKMKLNLIVRQLMKKTLAKFIRMSILSTGIIFISSVALAEGKPMRINYFSSLLSTFSTGSHYHRMMLDAAPLLMNGIGIAYERTLHSKITFGPYFSLLKFTSTQEKNDGIDFKTDVRIYGVRARYFLSEDADQSGIYVMAGVGAVQVATEASYSGLSANASSIALGGMSGAGYQYIQKISDKKLALSVGATYSSGYSVENQAIFDSQSHAEVTKPKAKGSIFLEGNIAFLF